MRIHQDLALSTLVSKAINKSGEYSHVWSGRVMFENLDGGLDWIVLIRILSLQGLVCMFVSLNQFDCCVSQSVSGPMSDCCVCVRSI